MVQKLKYYLDKLLAILRVRPLVVGLEISDAVLRLAYFDGKTWRLNGIRLAPGIIEAGKIKNHDQFVAALRELKSRSFFGREAKKKVNAIVSLSSINIYSQVFSLPIIEGENFDKAIQLNIQMVSPAEISQTYSGWQKVGEDQGALRLEILSAFIDRPTVDELSRALFDAGFLVVILESRALALARVLREQAEGVDANNPYIMFDLDNSGLDFLIIRRSQLYFEYFVPWRDVMDEKGQISMSSFEAAITRSLHQVVNFYSQHWPEPLGEIVLSATALKDEAQKTIKDNFPFVVKELSLRLGRSIGPEWFVALGCSLRGIKPRSQDKEMSLLGIGAEEEFRREQLTNFADFWRLLMPLALGMLLVLFLLADLFLLRTRQSLESQSLFNLNEVQAKENQALQDRARDFNKEVAWIGGAEKATVFRSKFLGKISGLLVSHGIIADRLVFGSPDAPIIISGVAQSETRIADLKKAIEGDPAFQAVSLPLSDVRPGQSGVSFSMTFRLAR